MPKTSEKELPLNRRVADYMQKYLDENIRKDSYAALFKFNCTNCKKFRDNIDDRTFSFKCDKYQKLVQLETEPDQLRKKYAKKYLDKSKDMVWGGDLLDFIPELKKKKEQEIEKSKINHIKLYLMQQLGCAKRLKEIEIEKKEVKSKIIRCLYTRAHQAVKDYSCFIDQERYVADCKICSNYLAEVDHCIQRRNPLRKKRGYCQYFKFDKDEYDKINDYFWWRT